MVNDNSKYFVFNGKKSSDFGVWCSGFAIFETPAKRFEQIDVPGRNGALIIEDGSYENVEIEFKDCFIPYDFPTNFSNLKNWLYRQKGYQRLELSWLPDEYRLAAFEGDISPTIKNWDGMGHFDLVFNCKPQRFLKSGEEPIVLMNWTDMSTIETGGSPTVYGKTSALIGHSGVGNVTLTFNKKSNSAPSLDCCITFWSWIDEPSSYEDNVEYMGYEYHSNISDGDSISEGISWNTDFMTIQFIRSSGSDDLSGWEIFVDYIDDNGNAIYGIFADSLDIINPTEFATNPLVVSHNEARVALTDTKYAMFFPGLNFSYQNTAGDFVKKYELSVEYSTDSRVTGYGNDVYFDTENQYAYCKKASSSTDSGIEYKQYDAIHIVDEATGAWTRIYFPNLCETVTRISYEPSETWGNYFAGSDHVYWYELFANGDSYKAIYPRWFTI